MFTDKDKAIAEHLIQEKIISQDQLLTIQVEVDCRGPGSLLNVLLHTELIDVKQMIKIINAVKEKGGYQPSVPRRTPQLSKISGEPFPHLDDEAVTRKPGELRPVTGPGPTAPQSNRTSHWKTGQTPELSKISGKPFLHIDDQAVTRKPGELRPITGPGPTAPQSNRTSPGKTGRPMPNSRATVRTLVIQKPDRSILRTQERKSPVPQAGFLATNFLNEGLGALDRFEKSIQHNTDIPKSSRMSLITYVYKARAAFREMQKRLGLTEPDQGDR